MPRPVTCRRAITVLTTAAVAVLAGCGPDPLPVHSEVSWADGREPVGPFEDDPARVVINVFTPCLPAPTS